MDQITDLTDAERGSKGSAEKGEPSLTSNIATDDRSQKPGKDNDEIEAGQPAEVKRPKLSEDNPSESLHSSDPSSSDSSISSDSDASLDPDAAKDLVDKLKAKLRKAKAKEAKALLKTKEKKAGREKDADGRSSGDESENEISVVKSSSYPPMSPAKTARWRAFQRSLQDLNFGPVVGHFERVDTIFQNGKPVHRTVIENGKPALESSLIQDIKPVKPKNKKPGSPLKVAYKRVDQLWDERIHNYKLTKTVKNHGDSEWDQYVFTVRRKFDLEHSYLGTLVDIKSQPLKECLQFLMEGVQGVSLQEAKPSVDPNMLFLHLEEMRAYMAWCQETASKSDAAYVARCHEAALTNDTIGDDLLIDEFLTKAKHLELMVKYLDKDYDETKKSLHMLENNQITFELLWALYKPGTIAYSSTYGDHEEPRAFKIDAATKQIHYSKGTWYSIEGRYLDFDGKTFGMTGFVDEVPQFEGAREITDLECYPLKYHKDAENLEAELIQRGKHFVSLEGMNYRYYDGMAYKRVKKGVMKINIDGRIMVDAAVHHRVNPNYRIIPFKPKPSSAPLKLVDADEGEVGSEQESSSDEIAGRSRRKVRRYRFVSTSDGKKVVLDITGDKDNVVDREVIADPNKSMHEFTSEELLVASPVVLGFAFAEKLWLEFKVSAISEVVYNDEAFDSLVLPENQKSLVKALVSSHAFQGHKSIDDIISGKGRGLVAVLHGPPGTGKTLTAEGIADLLKRPLYMVSAGDLGTEATRLEKELQNVLDVAHSWGAILLLDEADVFLQERSIHDIHRNALVSIFLRLLEYFQGILFLTTNRVETFDSAFVSRIHLSLRFQPLTTKAKKTVWKLFLDRVKKQEGMEVADIRESDITDLARRDVNGRQIKNLVRSTQALAVYENVPLSMMHIRRVIDVAENFEVDLRGGTGFTDAMRSYT
ncbi:hypothetical protein PV11_08375 [Exophiala sideris]|uniref:AAA+ ATPase domain-containing protein n=1 Tax=Exophiala sideris TaxID=1016849 RepID=A0A0D1YIS2_9EURO|nr:hypothetical protein PV11_08375 [Exophiala sideris]